MLHTIYLLPPAVKSGRSPQIGAVASSPPPPLAKAPGKSGTRPGQSGKIGKGNADRLDATRPPLSGSWGGREEKPHIPQLPPVPSLLLPYPSRATLRRLLDNNGLLCLSRIRPRAHAHSALGEWQYMDSSPPRTPALCLFCMENHRASCLSRSLYTIQKTTRVTYSCEEKNLPNSCPLNHLLFLPSIASASRVPS